MLRTSRKLKLVNHFALLVVALIITACDSGSPGERPGTLIIPPEGSILYISDNDGDAVISYDNADTVGGLAAPDRNITGAATTLNGPRGIAVDMARDLIYVANFGGNEILVYDGARSATGDLAPIRHIAGGLTNLNGPSRLYLDQAADRLYVTNAGRDSVLIFDNISAKDGNTPFSRELVGLATTLSAPNGVAVDPTRDRLYVSNGADQILIFADASSINGDIAPVGTVAGGNTSLDNPAGLYIDALNDRLFVANAGNISIGSIAMYSSASEVTGNVDKFPAGIASVPSTLINHPQDVYVDLATDRLYVANTGGNNVLVFENAGGISDASTPVQILSLPVLTTAQGLFVDITPFVVSSSAGLDGEIFTTDGSPFPTAVSAGGGPRTGDIEEFPPGSPDTVHRQFFSFGLSSFPASVTIAVADLRLYQASVSGTPTPYGISPTSLGNVLVDHVDYGLSLDALDFDAIALTSNIGTLSSDETLEYKTLLVTNSVQDDIDNARGQSQFRVRFPTQKNNDADSDFVQFTDAEDSCCIVNRPPQLLVTLFAN